MMRSFDLFVLSGASCLTASVLRDRLTESCRAVSTLELSGPPGFVGYGRRYGSYWKSPGSVALMT